MSFRDKFIKISISFQKNLEETAEGMPAAEEDAAEEDGAEENAAEEDEQTFWLSIF